MSEKVCDGIKAENQPDSSDKRNNQNNANKVVEVGTPAIFKLNIDCFNKLFDYLSRKDLYAISQTCKTLKQVAGEFFRISYESSEEYIECCEFNQFATNLIISSWNHVLNQSHYDEVSSNQKLKQVRFLYMILCDVELHRVEKMLRYAQTVILDGCKVESMFYLQFPKLCPNLKRLYVRDTDFHRNDRKSNVNEWLLWQYPALEHLEWIHSNDEQKIDELKLFFEQHPNVRSFATNANGLWESRNSFLEGQVKLDDLSIEMGEFEVEPQNVDTIFNLLREFHVRGIFKRLHLNFICFSQQTIEKMNLLEDALLTLKSIRLNQCISESITLPQLINLKELEISFSIYAPSLTEITDVNTLARELVNLERIHFAFADMSEITPFIYRSAKLRKMKIENLVWQDDNNLFLDLSMLNHERAKLSAAHKIIIYIGEEKFLATKWSMKQTEFNLIEMRRATSHKWGHHFHK